MVQASGVVHGVLCWCNQQLGVGQLVQGQGVGSLVQEGVPPVGKMQCVCRKRVGFKWVVGKRARAPRCIYRPFVLLGMYICQYDAWKE